MVARALRARAIVAVLFATTAFAGETWDGNGGDNDWSTANNWTPNGAPPNDGTANIVMAGTNRLTPRVDIDWDVSSLVFSNTAGGFSISGGAGVSLGIGTVGISNQDTQLQILLLPIDLNASQSWIASQGPLAIGNTITGHPILPRTLTLTGANSIHISGAITNSIAINKNGTGTLTFDGVNTNTYTGATTVSAGTLVLDRTGGLNRAIPDNLVIGDGFGSDTVRLDSANQISEAAGSTVTVNSSGLFNLNGFNETLQNLTINGGSVSGVGTLFVNGAISSGASSSGGTISGGTVNLSGANTTISVSDGAATVDLQIASTVANGSLTKTGAGVLQLSMVNTYTGTTTVNAGELQLNGSSLKINGDLTIGDASGSDVVRLMADAQIFIAENSAYDISSAVTIRPSGLLNLDGHTQTLWQPEMEGGTVSTGSGTLRAFGGLHVLASPQPSTITGNLITAGNSWDPFSQDARDGSLIVDDGAAIDDLVVDGPCTNFVKTGSGQMRLVGNTAPSYGFDAPSVQVVQGTLVLDKTITDGAVVGDVTVSGASLQLAANEQIASANPSNDVIIAGTGATLNLAGFSEAINDLQLQTGGTVKTDGGTLVARNLTMWRSTLAPASGLVTITGTIKSIAVANSSLIAGNVNLAAPDKSIDVPDGTAAIDLEISLALAGTSLTKTGAGTLLLSGAANTYSGTTTVSGGVLALGESAVDGAVPGNLVVTGATVRSLANEQIGTSGTITLNAAGLLDLNEFTETIGNLSLNGGAVTTGAGTLIVTGSITQSASAVASISGRLSLGGGTRTITSNDVPVPAVDLDIPAQILDGGIVKQGTGGLRLSGNNIFSAGLHHQTGMLFIAHDNAPGSGTLWLEGGTIEADDGARNIANPVVVTSFSTVTGSNPLTFGGSFTTNPGAALLKSGSGTLTIAGTQTHASGAAIFATAGTVDFNSSTTGGTLGISLSNAGTLVNFNADQDLGTLVVNGGLAIADGSTLLHANTLNVNTDATLEFEIGGLIPGDEFAQFDVSGNAGLAGILDITLINGFEPQTGQSFVILTFGSRSGAFEHVTGMAAGPGKVFRVQYNPTDVTLVVGLPAPGDFDHDGDVDNDDVLHFESCATGPGAPQNAPNCLNADLDGDADVDQSDFGLMQRCHSGDGNSADPNCMN